MKKKLIIFVLAVAVIFILSLFFAKPVANLFLKETDISYTVGEKKNVTLNEGDFVVLGEYLDESILWKVVDVENSAALLQTNYVITFKCFDACHGGNSDIGKLGKAQWETSSLKKWLNAVGDVNYGEAVPNKESVFNGKNSYENEPGFLSGFTKNELDIISSDGVFLLSKAQLKKLSEKDRVKTASKSAILQDESGYILSTGRNIWYWTSSAAGTNRTSVTTVTSSGEFYKASAFDGVTGVAPAVHLKSRNIISVSGDGSKAKPYVINRGE